jgi:hypothetical protein
MSGLFGCRTLFGPGPGLRMSKVYSEMPHRVFRFEDYEDTAKMSPLREFALDAVEMMGKLGLATVPYEPNEAMVDAAMEASGASEAQVRAVFKAMIAAFDADDLELADFAN